MRRGGRHALLGATVACGLWFCPGTPVAAHEADEAVGERGCVERSFVSEEAIEAAMERASERLNGMPRGGGPEFFPVKSEPLRSGSPTTIRVRGLPAAVFAIGADEASLGWLAANAGRLRANHARLRANHARGLLVSAESEATLRRMRAFAARFGLSLDPMPGAALATAFGATSYPFVAEPSE